ncbi:MAG TPA: hypothetical protein VK900_05930 [Anaerolineales bacterium]|nr:hypothetical protein [Anaerolineales bacterium]
MNQTTKTVLIILGSLLVLCACTTAILLGTGLWSFGKFVQFADNSTTEDPREVAQIASQIADFNLPDGFTTQYGIHIATFSMVQYTTRGEEMYIFLIQFPAGTSINPKEMLRHIRENSRDPNSIWYNTDTQLVEEKKVTICGEETTLSISEGTNDQGTLYRMANAKFQGNGAGPALFMMVGPAAQWDAEMVEDFIASIH